MTLMNLIRDDFFRTKEDIKGINLASQDQSGFDPLLYANLRQKLMQAAETAKKELSQSDSANIVVANLYEKDGIEYS